MGETVYHHRSLGELSDPWLQQSLRAWRRLADARGSYPLGRDLEPILGNRELVLPASTLLVADGRRPEDFVIAWQGEKSQTALGRNLLGCRWGAFFDAAYAAAAAAPLAAVMNDVEIAYHEVVAHIGGRLFHYDRLLYPITWRGSVDMLLAVARWRTPHWH